MQVCRPRQTPIVVFGSGGRRAPPGAAKTCPYGAPWVQGVVCSSAEQQRALARPIFSCRMLDPAPATGRLTRTSRRGAVSQPEALLHSVGCERAPLQLARAPCKRARPYSSVS